MRNRMKEDERIEKAIRSLLKLPENRRCINCCSLGPQYVCTTFWTFVCTNCSGLHREFTHRVKSVSMAKFTAEEVSSLEAGGNERARQIYFKDWDPKHNSYPDGSNILRLRDFIRHVYVDRKYTGENNDKLPRLRLTDKEYNESNKINCHHVASKSLNFEEKIEGTSTERGRFAGRGDGKAFRFYYDERRSPRFSQESCRSGGFKRSPVRFEVVDDRVRDDRVRSGRRSDGPNFSNMDSKGSQKNQDGSSSPHVQPIRKTLGENPLRLQLGNISKVNDKKDVDSPAHIQKKAASCGNLQSVDGNPAAQKKENSGSLIDFFGGDFQASYAIDPPKLQKMPPSDDGATMSSSGDALKEKGSQAQVSNPLESLLFELSPSSVGPGGGNPEAPSNKDSTLNAPGDQLPASSLPEAEPVGMISMSASTGASSDSSTNAPVQHCDVGSPISAPDSSGCSILNYPQIQQLSIVQQHHPSSSLAAYNSTIAQQTASPAATVNNQPWKLNPSNTQESFSASKEQSSQDTLKPTQDNMSGAGVSLHPVETKYTGRKELPMDLFTSSYLLAPQQMSGWQSAPSHGVGYNMQYYHNEMAKGEFPRSDRSINPFDFNDETNSMQTPQFPAMASQQGGIPNMSAATSLLRTSSLVSHSSGLMTPQSSSYVSPMAPQSPPFASIATSGAYMGQEPHNSMAPSSVQGAGNFGTEGNAFGALNLRENPSSGHPEAKYLTSFSSSSKGNPFG